MQLQRHLGCEYNTAWFLHHRVMEAMRRGGLASRRWAAPARSSRSTRRITARWTKPASSKQPGPSVHKGGKRPRHKRAIVSLVERGGNVRSFHVPTADAATVAKIVRENVHGESRLHTDESKLYVRVGTEFAAHETVNHAAKRIRSRRRDDQHG